MFNQFDEFEYAFEYLENELNREPTDQEVQEFIDSMPDPEYWDEEELNITQELEF